MTNQTNKDPLIHFPFYINQYQGILSRYSFEEKGAFISLLCVFLAEDTQLPDNQEQLFRMCLAFTEGERKAVLSVKDKVIETALEILKYRRRNLVGDKHWNWRGGITPENNTIRRSQQNREWRKAVFIRDDFTCKKCAERGKKLHAHHIKEFAKYPALRFEISNGMTLCQPCHIKIHSRRA